MLALKSTMDQRFIKFWTQLDPLPWFIVIYTYPLKSKHLFKYQYCLQFYMNLPSLNVPPLNTLVADTPTSYSFVLPETYGIIGDNLLLEYNSHLVFCKAHI